MVNLEDSDYTQTSWKSTAHKTSIQYNGYASSE